MRFVKNVLRFINIELIIETADEEDYPYDGDRFVAEIALANHFERPEDIPVADEAHEYVDCGCECEHSDFFRLAPISRFTMRYLVLIKVNG